MSDTFRIRDAADLLGVSDDTLRRWIEAGRLESSTDGAGRAVVAGADLARLLRESAERDEEDLGHRTSARNRFSGLVTAIQRDGLMAQVELQCGPHRVVSLMTAEAADELELRIGSRASAIVKATMVIVETHEPTGGTS